MASVWLSLVSDIYDCSKCKRDYKTFACPNHEQVDMDWVYKLLEDSNLPSSMPDVFKLEQLNICPLVLRSAFTNSIARAFNWWEKGQLGMTYLESPAWVEQAFSLLSAEREKVRAFKRQQDRSK